MHGGRSYRVREVTLTGGSGGEILLEPAEAFRRTNAYVLTFLAEQDVYDGWRWTANSSDINVFYGKVLITDSLNSVQEV